MRILTAISILLIPLCSVASILPADRMGPWSRTNVGVDGGIPNSSNMTVFANVPVGTSLASLNSTLAICPSNQVVQLAAGTFTFTNNITIPSGVVLRGAGMSNTVIVFTSGGISASGGSTFYNALRSSSYSGGGLANWTAGYSQGTTTITLSTNGPGLIPGNILYLDQADDSFFVNNVGYEGATGGPRDATHTAIQFVKVVSTNGNNITISPPIASTWIASGLGPGAVWVGASAWITRVGVENLTVDGTSSVGTGGGGGANIDFECAHDCWVKGVLSLNCHVQHVYFGFGAFRCELRDSYMYGTQNSASQSYGVDLSWASSCLVENNVFEHIAIPMLPHASPSVNVFDYNYTTNDWYIPSANFLMAGLQPHQSHCWMELYEGNHTTKYAGDFIHGSHSHEVLFRNRLTGWESYSYPSGPTANNLQCELLDITNRYFSSVGNILGTATIYTHYNNTLGSGVAYGTSGYIYQIGLANPGYANYPGGWEGAVIPNDTNTAATMFIHMDYDVVTGGITYNSTNADVTLPASLVYSSKPSFFGFLNWPPFNPTNTTAAAIDPTNIPAGYFRNYGVWPDQIASYPKTSLSIGGNISIGGNMLIGQ